MATVTINGSTYTVPDGSTVTVVSNTVTVGSDIRITGLGQTTHVEWKGPLGKLDCQSCTIHGDVTGNVDAQSVKCGNVGGDIDSQSVHCGAVKGDIDAMSVTRK